MAFKAINIALNIDESSGQSNLEAKAAAVPHYQTGEMRGECSVQEM